MNTAQDAVAGRRGIGVAVLGLGWMGQAHSRSVMRIPSLFPERRAEARLVVCADIDADRRRRAVADFGFERAVEDWREAVTAPDVDAVWVTAPNMLHVPMIEAACAAGKAVFSEKPIGGKPVAVIAASPTRMLRSDQQGGAELLKPNRSVMIDTGHSTIMTNASVGVRFVDSKTGETDRSGRERGQEFFGMQSRAVASWVNPAKPIADAKQATAFLAAVAEGKAEPMHGKFRQGMTAADVAFLTGAVRHPTENEKKFAALESNEPPTLIERASTIHQALSKHFRVTTRGAGREAFA